MGQQIANNMVWEICMIFYSGIRMLEWRDGWYVLKSQDRMWWGYVLRFILCVCVFEKVILRKKRYTGRPLLPKSLKNRRNDDFGELDMFTMFFWKEKTFLVHAWGLLGFDQTGLERKRVCLCVCVSSESRVYSTTHVCGDKFGKRQIVAYSYFYMRDI